MVKQAEKKRKQNRFLPVLGLFLAVAFAGVAYLLSPTVLNFLVSKGLTLADMSYSTVQLIVGTMIWLVLFGIGIFLVAVLAGRDPDEAESLRYYKYAKKQIEERRNQRGR